MSHICYFTRNKKLSCMTKRKSSLRNRQGAAKRNYGVQRFGVSFEVGFFVCVWFRRVSCYHYNLAYKNCVALIYPQHIVYTLLLVLVSLD